MTQTSKSGNNERSEGLYLHHSRIDQLCFGMGGISAALPDNDRGYYRIGAIIYYATGFPIQWSYFIINAVLMTFAIKILGPRFSIKTTYAIFMLTFLLWIFQVLVNNYIQTPDMSADGKPLLLGSGQDFMACIIGAAMCGVGLGITFNYNGSTGGTDIIAAIVNKYKDVSPWKDDHDL